MMTFPKPTIWPKQKQNPKPKQKTVKSKRSKTPSNQEEEELLMARLPKLPLEIVIEILSRLPVKTLLRFKCVSKDWRSLISGSHFISQHLNHSAENCPLLILGGLARKQIFTIKYETSCEVLRYDLTKFQPGLSWLEIVGSSNGLICLSFTFRDRDNVLCLCNPATLEIKLLPNAPIEYTTKQNYSYTAFGFGFDPTGNDYKVLAIDYLCRNMHGAIHPSEVKVYSLKTGQWRRLVDASFKFHLGTKNAVVNGAIHWMGDYGNMNDKQFIVSFDLGLETFQKIAEHEYQNENELYSKRVGVLGGCLSVFDAYTRQRIEIWVMKDYGVKDSWTKLFTINAPPSSECDIANLTVRASFHSTTPIVIRENGEVLLEKNQELVSYDPNSGIEKGIGPGGLPFNFNSIAYVESLVSLKVGYGQDGEPQA